MVASMSISGVPPFNGFFSKLLIIIACVQAGYWGFGLWAVIVSILTLASFMKVQKYAFYGKLKEKLAQIREVPIPMQCSMVLLAVLCLGMSLLAVEALGVKEFDSLGVSKVPSVVLKPAQEALQQGVKGYQEAVMKEVTPELAEADGQNTE